MHQNFLRQNRRLIIIFGAFTLLIQTYQIPLLAYQIQNEKAEAISELLDETNLFYLHPNATGFMNSFYTRESYNHLRDIFNQIQEAKTTNWESEMDDTTISKLYQLLRSALANLQPLIIRRGEATSQNQNLNFRAIPETRTQVLHTLTYGTSFEIIEEVQGGVVIGDDHTQSNHWFRIRYNGLTGYVHARYVRNLPVSEERVQLLADIGRQELWIQAKIEGWRTDFSPTTQHELQEILNTTRALRSDNWQFNLSYSDLNHMLQSLSYEHLNLVTLFRYDLINDIVRLKREIENNSIRQNYTEDSWNDMSTALTEAQILLIEDWQTNLTDEKLSFIHELLLSGLNGLELIIQPEQALENEFSVIDWIFNLEPIFILGTVALVAFAGIIILGVIVAIFKIINFIW